MAFPLEQFPFCRAASCQSRRNGLDAYKTVSDARSGSRVPVDDQEVVPLPREDRRGLDAASAIALEPKPPCRTGNAELPAQTTQGSLAAQRRHHESYSLFSNVHRFPRHRRFPPPRSLHSRGKCKASLETLWKGCHGTEHSFGLVGRSLKTDCPRIPFCLLVVGQLESPSLRGFTGCGKTLSFAIVAVTFRM